MNNCIPIPTTLCREKLEEEREELWGAEDTLNQESRNAWNSANERYSQNIGHIRDHVYARLTTVTRYLQAPEWRKNLKRNQIK